MFSSRDQTILDHLRKARALHVRWGELFDFHEQLFLAQFAFQAGLEAGDQGTFPRERGIHLARLAEGIPQITFDEFRMEAAPFMDLYKRIADLLNRYSGHLHPPGREPEPGTVIGYAREIFESRGPWVGPDQPADFVRTASGFVLAPYLRRASEILMPRIPQSQWHRGSCPVCGGLPSFAALHGESGSRTLLCSRCHGEWSFRRVGCPFCLNNDQQSYYPGEDGKYRLYVCQACHRYLKSLDLREQASPVSLPAEALATVSMDIAAQEKGYRAY